ncbi:MAG: beta strand repeat-containing protein, partial [bacterium]
VMAGGDAFAIDFNGDNLIRFEIKTPASKAPADGKALVTNTGTVRADGGTVMMTARAARGVMENVINSTGIVEAHSVSNQNGVIVLDGGDGTVNVSGTVDASGTQAGQTGGTVNMTGGTVNVADNTTITASGYAGGGQVNIGGEAHGQGTLAHAQYVNVGNATITADAITNGNGGSVVLWSDGSTAFNGSISAQGGLLGGNGGFVETSGHNLGVGLNAHVNTTAGKGATGTWLLDPDYIYIVDEGGDDPSCSASSCYIEPGSIVSALDTTNVTLIATNYIEVDDPVNYTSSNTFSLLSGGNIDVFADILNHGSGDINLVAGWDGETGWNSETNTFTIATVIANPESYGSGGDVTIAAPCNDCDPAVGSFSGTTTVATNNLFIDAANGPAQLGYQGAGGGDISVYALGDVTLTGSDDEFCSFCYAQIGNGGAEIEGGNSGNITVIAGGDVTLTAGVGSATWAYAQIGNGGDTSSGNASGDIVVSAGGSVTLTGAHDYAQIGNGGLFSSGSYSGDVTVEAGGDITLTGGSGEPYGYTQIGNGGEYADGNASGDIHVDSGGGITLTSETDSENYALIGNGGFGVDSGDASGNVYLSAQG